MAHLTVVSDVFTGTTRHAILSLYGLPFIHCNAGQTHRDLTTSAGNKYTFVTTTMTWYDASYYCLMNWNTQLAVLDSQLLCNQLQAVIPAISGI